MSAILSRFRHTNDEITEEEIAAAKLIVESAGNEVVEKKALAFQDNQCFICRAIGKPGVKETFMTITGAYDLFVCNECRDRFKHK